MASAKKMTYSEAVSEIEDILADMDTDSVDIDALASKVKRVSYLIDYCKKKLTKTEHEVQKIISSD